MFDFLKTPEKINVPDGKYEGLMSGYMFVFEHNGHKHNLEMEFGVRGINIKTTITIENNKIIDVI